MLSKLFTPVQHHQATWHGFGADHLPVDHRIASRPYLRAQPARRRRQFPHYPAAAKRAAKLGCTVKRNLCPMTPTPNFDPIVYVVDDDPAVLDSVSLLIRSAGLKVMAFPSALEFLAAFIPNQIACLVLDIRNAWHHRPGTASRTRRRRRGPCPSSSSPATATWRSAPAPSRPAPAISSPADRRRTADEAVRKALRHCIQTHENPHAPKKPNAPGPPVQPRAGSAATGHRRPVQQRNRQPPGPVAAHHRSPTAPACSTNWKSAPWLN